VAELLLKSVNDEITLVSMEFLANLYGCEPEIRDKLIFANDHQNIVLFFDVYEKMSNSKKLKTELTPSIVLFIANCFQPPYLETEYIFELLPIVFHLQFNVKETKSLENILYAIGCLTDLNEN